MSESPETNRDAYARGKIAGEIAGEISARLADHDRHFAAINGHLGDLAGEFRELRLLVQQLKDQAIARDAMTEKSLSNTEAIRWQAANDRWFPWARLFAVISALALAVSIILAVQGLN